MWFQGRLFRLLVSSLTTSLTSDLCREDQALLMDAIIQVM